MMESGIKDGMRFCGNLLKSS